MSKALAALALVCAAPTFVLAQEAFSAVPRDATLVVGARRLTDFARGLGELEAVKELRRSAIAVAAADAVLAGARTFSLYALGAAPAELARIAGRDVALALINPTTSDNAWVVVSALGRNAEAFDKLWLKTMRPSLRRCLPTASFTETKIKKRDACVLDLGKGKALAIARAGQYLLVGSRAGVAASLAVIGGKGQSLADMPAFSGTAPAMAPDVGLLLWLNAERLMPTTPSPNRPGEPDVRIRALAVATRVLDNVVEERVLLQPLATPRNVLDVMKTWRGHASRAAAFVPGDFDGFIAFGFKDGFDLDKRMEKLIETIGGEEKLTDYRAGQRRFEKHLGVDLQKELFGALGGEGFAAIKAPDLAALVKAGARPSPASFGYLIGVQCKKPEMILDLCDTVAALNDAWNLTSRHVAGVEIRTVSGPGMALFSPSYARLKDYLLFSPLEATLVSTVRSLRRGRTMARDPVFRKMRISKPPAFLTLFVKLQPRLPRILAAARLHVPHDARRFWPYIVTLARALPGVVVKLRGVRYGVEATVRSPLGAVAPAAFLATVDVMAKTKRPAASPGRGARVR